MRQSGYRQIGKRQGFLGYIEGSKIELWYLRVPDPFLNRGASGGHRLVYSYDENTAKVTYLLIIPRDYLNKSKAKDEYWAILKELEGLLP